MAGLLAWAADVVGGGTAHLADQDTSSGIPMVFTPEQQRYVQELDQKAASLSRSIQDLRLRIPPQDISQRLPHLHAHSLASNAALALQLNSHSATREQAQLREVNLQEENAAFEKAISNCDNKIQEKLQEADALQRKLLEMDADEKTLMDELVNAEAALVAHQFDKHRDPVDGSQIVTEEGTGADTSSRFHTLEKLENKKKELGSMEETVHELERTWEITQDNALKKPSPAQREKILDKQLHSLIEQLAAKQAQAESLVGEIHLRQKELEGLNGLSRRLEASSLEGRATRNRSGRSMSGNGFASSDYIVDAHNRPFYGSSRTESPQRPMLLRSTFVLYILVLHILVFIKLSF